MTKYIVAHDFGTSGNKATLFTTEGKCLGSITVPYPTDYSNVVWAEQKGEEENQNQFYMDEAAYKRLEPHLSKKEGMNSDAYKGYQTGPEYDDLECFLKVCQQLEIEPLIVIVPVNGYYYDFTGFPKEARQNYYEKVRTLAESYGARIADFSDQEYTKYFFEDRVHLGKKGWVMVDESLYNYYKEA